MRALRGELSQTHSNSCSKSCQRPSEASRQASRKALRELLKELSKGLSATPCERAIEGLLREILRAFPRPLPKTLRELSRAPVTGPAATLSKSSAGRFHISQRFRSSCKQSAREGCLSWFLQKPREGPRQSTGKSTLHSALLSCPQNRAQMRQNSHDLFIIMKKKKSMKTPL